LLFTYPDLALVLEIALILTDNDLVRINPTKTDIVPITGKATNFELNMGANSIEDQCNF
jgi:hypothetical protein